MGLFELVAYGFLVAAFLLFNWVSRQAKRRRLERQRIALEKFRQPAEARAQGGRGRADPWDSGWGRAPEPAVPEPVIPERRSREATPLEARPYEAAAYEPAAFEIAPGARPEAEESARGALENVPRRGPARRRRPSVLRTRAELRAAVIAMTVLGPCRALQPWEANEAPTAAGPARVSASADRPAAT